MNSDDKRGVNQGLRKRKITHPSMADLVAFIVIHVMKIIFLIFFWRFKILAPKKKKKKKKKIKKKKIKKKKGKKN